MLKIIRYGHLVFFLFFLSIAYAASIPEPEVTHLKTHLEYLASDELEGRGIGTLGLWKAADYISEKFEEYGLEPLGDNETYLQKFFVTLKMHPKKNSNKLRLPVANVVALLPANDEDLKENYIVIGAHYDHLGYGSLGSLESDNENIHNGADDNASGTAGVLEAARLWSQTTKKHGNIVFVAFAAEELGLLGSRHFVKNAPYDLSKTFAMFNMDMIGRMREDTITIFGTGTAAEWDEQIDLINFEKRLIVKKQASGQSPSDNTSFYRENIPVLFFNTGSHSEYHKPSDDTELVNFEGIAKVVSFLNEAVLFVAQRFKKLEFQETKDPHDPGNGGGGMPYFGTMPDYGFEGAGVLLQGVTEGSPAWQAGLRKGDIIIRLGEHETTDVYAYTDALKAHKAGDTVDVVYLREGTEVSTKATFRKKGE